MAKEKYGFVYIWRDKKHNRYYIGCHWGQEDDRYVCSSNWMKKAYKIRPSDFHRRILVTNIKSREETFATEMRFFKMIKPHEMKTRYYNLNITSNLMWYASTDSVELFSKSQRGTALYKDLNGNTIGRLRTDDSRVLSGEYVGYKSGMKHSEEALENIRRGHDSRRTTTVYNSSLMERRFVLLTELGDYLSAGWTEELDDVWRAVGKINQKAGAKLANTGSIGYYYPDGTLYGRLKHDDPAIEEYNLKHIRSDKQMAQASYQQKLVANDKEIQAKKSKTMSVKKWYHDPITLMNTRAIPGCAPLGFLLGRAIGETKLIGTKFWNNGLENRRFKPYEIVPEGWLQGMKPR